MTGITSTQLNTIINNGGFLHIRHEESTGVNGGGGTFSSWNTRPISNIQSNGIINCSVNTTTNEITLPPGSYQISGSVLSYNSGNSQIRLRNTTDSINEVISLVSTNNTTENKEISITGKFVLYDTKTLEIQHYYTNTETNAYGSAVSIDTEVYMDVTISMISASNNGFTNTFNIGNASGKSYTGLTIENDSADPDKDITITAGKIYDWDNDQIITLSDNLIKQLDTNWVVGTPGGSESGGFPINSYYYTNEIPIMTANDQSGTTGHIVSASAEDGGAAYLATNENLDVGNDWATSSPPPPQWWKIRFPINKTIVKYSITNVNNETYVNGYPSSWTFEGSNDDSNWDILDTQTGQVLSNSETKEYEFINTTPYLYYRINISSAGNSPVVIANIKMFEKTISSPGPDTWYHVFLIWSNDGSLVDAGFDNSPTAINLLNDAVGYDNYKRIGSIKTDASNNIKRFYQFGNMFMWNEPIADYIGRPSTSGLIIVMSTPKNIRTKAFMNVRSESGNDTYISCPDVEDMVPSLTVAPFVSVGGYSVDQTQVYVHTDLNSQIRVRDTDNSSDIKMSVLGWEDFNL